MKKKTPSSILPEAVTSMLPWIDIIPDTSVINIANITAPIVDVSEPQAAKSILVTRGRGVAMVSCSCFNLSFPTCKLHGC
jgi:hypothetical protein